MMGLGITIIEDPNLYDSVWHQVRFPKSHKKRIRRKFRKMYGKYVRVDKDVAYQMGGTIICSPTQVRRIREEIAARCSASQDLLTQFGGRSRGVLI